MDIRVIIEKKIKAANLNKKDLAERVGIASQNVNKMISSPTWATLERIAAALGLSVSELVADDGGGCGVSHDEHGGGLVCPVCGARLVVSPADGGGDVSHDEHGGG
ncbi:MAG: helix-turn-helix transcriptional regulator [Prevotella sp.]|nr:helix-turn-helix transcriptional regulator [Prevotella sp.]